MNSDVFKIAAEIISKANHEKPADQVLRETFKRYREIAPFDATEISRMVFMYYRWQEWVAGEKTSEDKLRRARDWATRFETNPAFFSSEELRAKAVPPWALNEVAVTDDWLKSLQGESRLWLRARRGQGKNLANKLGHCRAAGEGALRDTLQYSGTEDLFRSPEFHAGEFELQDIASQAVGLICDPKPGETWWDACAGEGGKLLHLSDLMENKGLIWASDRAAWRLQKLKRRTSRAKAFNYRSELWDGGAKLPTKTKFNGILVDAPCSGVGTWQRNPHARWTTTLQDVHELGEVQKKLLSHVANSVKPGGKLIYAVCTLTNSETNLVADAFEAQFKDFKPLPVLNPLALEKPAAARVWIWPQDSRGNGMFVAAWQR
ncbi:MAG: RsmB/NOP family class I SAM-dependent RNA methyltransferase [Akkermansiaceae bacterium]|nr:RsmB/NOP family class I SAM-dependent RNA methyltransferase [Verrucomicrobiales bacterium]